MAEAIIHLCKEHWRMYGIHGSRTSVPKADRDGCELIVNDQYCGKEAPYFAQVEIKAREASQ